MNELISLVDTVVVEQRIVNEELFSRWISYIDASPKTINTYAKAIKQFSLYLSKNNIKRPKKETVLAYRDYLKYNHKPTTVDNYLVAVRLFFKWTEEEGLYANIADRVKGVKLNVGHKKDYLTTRQVVKFLETINRSNHKGLRDYAMLSLMVTTGLRTISVIRANIEDIRTVGDSVVLYYQGKGHEEKVNYVKLAEPVEEAIRAYLNVRKEKNLKAPLFGSISNRNSGERMTTRSIRRIAKKCFMDIGLESNRITAHSLRHTAATLNLLNGATVEETQQLLGHSNINTTLIYSHALERAKNNSEQRIARAIFG